MRDASLALLLKLHAYGKSADAEVLILINHSLVDELLDFLVLPGTLLSESCPSSWRLACEPVPVLYHNVRIITVLVARRTTL